MPQYLIRSAEGAEVNRIVCETDTIEAFLEAGETAEMVLETDEVDAVIWAKVRTERDLRLAACDWTQIPDAPVNKIAWMAYRQALRDLPQNTIDPRDPAWPVAPE